MEDTPMSPGPKDIPSQEAGSPVDINSETHKNSNQIPPPEHPKTELKHKTIDNDQPNKKGNDRFQRRHFWVQVGLLVATTLAFGAAAYYAHIANLTLDQITGQTKSIKTGAEAAKSAAETAKNTLEQNKEFATNTLNEMKNQSRTMQDATEANRKAVELAERSIKATQDQFRLDQRAWINIVNAKFRGPFDIKKPLRIDFATRNSGKTPALQVRWNAKLWIKYLGDNLPAFYKNPSAEIVYGPGDERIQSINWGKPFSQQQIDLLQSEKGIFFIEIKFTYFDIYDTKKPHHTCACFYFNPKVPIDLGLEFCETGCSNMN